MSLKERILVFALKDGHKCRNDVMSCFRFFFKPHLVVVTDIAVVLAGSDIGFLLFLSSHSLTSFLVFSYLCSFRLRPQRGTKLCRT